MNRYKLIVTSERDGFETKVQRAEHVLDEQGDWVKHSDLNKTHLEKVLEFFNGDCLKALTWYNAENPMLGGVKPIDMIAVGREARLIKFVDENLSENKINEQA